MNVTRTFHALTLIACLTLMQLLAYGQYEDKISVTLPSPNNPFAAAYLSNNVNLFSGTPSIKLSLYDITAGSLTVPVGLIYKASGVRLQDYSSIVGMSWMLQSGGMVTRTVRGLPDEAQKGYIGPEQVGVQINAGGENDQARADKIAKREYDGEPDLFYISTPRLNISFVFDQNGVPVFNEPTGVKVWFERPNASDNTNITFYVKDVDGTKYTFGAAAGEREMVSGPPDYISTWYLSSVNNLNNNEQITFTYSTGANITTKIYNRIRIKLSSTGSCTGGGESTANTDSTRTYKEPKYLTTISGTAGEMRFFYTDNRLDLPGARSLHRIEVWNKTDNKPVRKFLFKYGYFHGANYNDLERNRLFLDGIYAFSGDEQHSVLLYKMEYYVNELLKFPSRGSAAYDHLGFYNNNSESTPFVPEANKNPDFEKTLQYTLKSVQHAQGGKTEYEYELNTYYDAASNSNKTSGGLRIKRIKEYDNTGNAYSRSYDYTSANGFSSGEVMIKNPGYKKLATQWVIFPPSGCALTAEITNAGILYNITDLNGQFTSYSRVKVTNPDGGYEITQFPSYNTYPDVFTIYNSYNGNLLTIEQIRQFGFPTSYAYKRGKPRFKYIYNAANQLLSETAYNYTTLIPEQRKARGITVSLSYFLSGSDFRGWFQNVYYQSTEALLLTNETEKIYDLHDPAAFITKTKDYEYNAAGTLIRKITYNSSEGQSYADKVYYPENRNELTGLSAGETQAYTFMDGLSIPLRQERLVNGTVMSAHYTQYNAYTPETVTRVFPEKTRVAKTGSTLSDQITRVFDLYSGKLNTLVAKDGLTTGYIWSADNILLAKSENATGSEIYYQSFEALPGAVTGNAFTGKKYWQGSFTVSFVRPNARNYKYSYRRFVNNSWQRVAGNYTTNNMVINEPYPIDDIRVHPDGAVMNTYTHEPLVGLTSFSDGNENVQYYEYDWFHRLSAMRDAKKNIIRQIEYSFSCECPYVKPVATIEYQNQYTDFWGLDEYHFADVVLIMKYPDGTPFIGSLSVNYSIYTDTQNGATTTYHQVNPNGAGQYILYNGLIAEYHYVDGAQFPVSWNSKTYFVEPGTGYQVP